MAAKKQFITTKDVCRILNVTPMAIYNYRTGRTKGKTLLPFHVEAAGEKRHRVKYVLAEVLKWAKWNGVEVTSST